VFSLIQWAARLPRNSKRAIMLTADLVMIPLVLYVAISLKLGSFRHTDLTGWWPYFAALATTVPVFVRLGLYRAIVRYIGGKAIHSVVAGVTISAVSMLLLDFLVTGSLPVAAIAIYWALALVYVAGSRALVRDMFFFYGLRLRQPEKVAIYGAGAAGARLFTMLLGGADFDPVAFVDDKSSLHGSHINGITVVPPSELPSLIKEHGVRRILLALPAASRRRRQEILMSIESLGAHVQSMPELSDLVSGRARIDELRDVDALDLLGRDPVPPDTALFRQCIENKSVMVTGAGGSIGSELCRQILTLRPFKLVLFEMSELALYNIEAELRQTCIKCDHDVEIVALLGNAHHRQRMRDVMSACRVQTVYHAAAYKHVPIVEHNMIEGLHNNVIGTWYAAESALETGVETFVLVSTDKAVNPANIMGASKRFAEIVLQGMQNRGAGRTRFCMVRFGNVLDSSGSVVPLFREQIRAGGPVTVTHRDVTRYFMTIPEAVQLVIQAGAMGRGGDVFVLDMGRPVRIDDLARRMIGLMGLTVRDEINPDGDIEIKYTGLRTAEKLFEELLIGTNVAGTDHPRIMRAIEHSLPWEKVQTLLNDLLAALATSDCKKALACLMEAVVEYRHDGEVQDEVWRRQKAVVSRLDSKVTLIPRRRSGDFPVQVQIDVESAAVVDSESKQP
jgi:FlaA1/EpsC-like NDP-sugar epimerase